MKDREKRRRPEHKNPSSYRKYSERRRSREKKQHRTMDLGSSSESEGTLSEKKIKEDTKKKTHRHTARGKGCTASGDNKRNLYRKEVPKPNKLKRKRKQLDNNSNNDDANNRVKSEDVEKSICNDKSLDVVDIGDDELVVIDADGGETSEGSCMEINSNDLQKVDMKESEKYMDVDDEDSYGNGDKAFSDVDTRKEIKNQASIDRDESKTSNKELKRSSDDWEQSYSSESESGELTDSSSEDTEHSTDSNDDSYIVLDYEGFEEEGEEQDVVTGIMACEIELHAKIQIVVKFYLFIFFLFYTLRHNSEFC